MVAVHLAAQPFFAGGIINGVGHRLGYRSFEMPSTATNIVPWALLLGGEELHNNHHAFPRSARFAVQPWEIDIGWLWIRLFRALGQAEVRREAPHPHFVAARATLDADTVRALFITACMCCATMRAASCDRYAGSSHGARLWEPCRARRPCSDPIRAPGPEGGAPYYAPICSRAMRCCAPSSSFATACSIPGTAPQPIRRAPCSSCGTGAYALKRAAFAPCVSLP